MGKHVYSASKNACFPLALEARYRAAGLWPEDAVDISDDLYDEVVRLRPPNKRIAPGPNGTPTLVDVIDSVLLRWDQIRSERDRRQLDGGVKVGNNWFLSNERATSEYNTIISMLTLVEN